MEGMDGIDEIEESVDAILAQRDALRRRLGEWQALAVDFLECRHDESGLAECFAEAATMLREDVCPSLAAPSSSVALAQAQELNARLESANADMDAQRAAAVLEATELRDALAPLQERVQYLETVRQALMPQRDGGEILLRERTTEVMQLLQANARLSEEVEALRNVGGWADTTADLAGRLRQVELHGAQTIGGVRSEPPAATIDQAHAALGEALRQASDAYAAEHADRMAAQSIAEAEVAPEPDQNHTETIPAPKKNRLSEAARQKASANMKAMLARKAAEKQAAAERDHGLSMAQIAARRAIFNRVWRATPLPLDREFLQHTMRLNGLTRAQLVQAVLTLTEADMARTADAAEFYRACQEDATLAELPEPTDAEMADAAALEEEAA